MIPGSEKNDNDDWELHPLFLSKIPDKKDIDKNTALSALITLINEEEEKEVFNYEPRRKNLQKKITEKGEIIYKKDRRNLYQPYQNKKDFSFGEKQIPPSNRNTNNNRDHDREKVLLHNVEPDNVVTSANSKDSDNQNTGETSIGEVLVCLSMLNLK
ncbi:hypothetical protein POVCU2_0082000 [Plasmodium ovale curtisi]|uniref:Uncharacterized protein n=1 Tax=Plasmodium ovale curtisi TaxID=864141 RepID=A0A1A8WMT1_PLAOA|nr:hypothetical protein POVCU2_0082000 [Plasmodium ovale curtisi]